MFAAILSIIVWTFVAWGSARLLIIKAPLARADAMVMLSGSATFRERAQLAASLFHAGRSQKIILTNDNRQSGWSIPEQKNPYFYERARDELAGLGVTPQNIEVLGPAVYSTYDEAVLLRQYANSHGLHSILIVTSAYHSRRALWTFGRVFQGSGIQIGLEPVETGIQTPGAPTWWLHLRGWQMVAGEYLKFAYYKIHYA